MKDMSIERIEPKVTRSNDYKDFVFIVGNRGEGLRDYVSLAVRGTARHKLPIRVKELPHLHIEVYTDSKLPLASIAPIINELIDLNCKVNDEAGLLEAINTNLEEMRKDPKYQKPF
jgi:hypothetical protein